ncbi:MAG: cobalamin-independent methionine synthase II family protein [Xanthobacteraceae bacterium]|nr:cobalamin-independent methionine synthase II family protein [Xanthobacteraceae bacterium]
MRRSTQRILTTHVGSLPRPDDLVALNARTVQALASGQPIDESERAHQLRSAVSDVVQHQRSLGIDVVNDGEFGKAMRRAVDYGAWWSYVYDRLAGFELRQSVAEKGRGAWTFGSKERKEFAEFYAEDGGMGSAQTGSSSARMYGLTCTGPVKYVGHAAIKRDIDNLKAALAGARVEDLFMTAVSPATLQILPNEHYKNREDYTWALAEAIHEEYKAIVDAGFILQIDDPALVDIYDWWFSLNSDMAGYRKWAVFQVEAVNHALEGIPEDRVRFHICWGSWHGPHKGDVPLKDVVDLLLKVKAQGYSVEAGNVRHEHEWKVFRDVKVPEGKVLIPGVVSHATNVLEHPEVVADRLINYASVVGRENVIASTDCGLGGRIHPQLAWAKLKALREGADLASKQLWR